MKTALAPVRALWIALFSIFFLASCEQIAADPAVGSWQGEQATLEITRDGTFLMEPAPAAREQGFIITGRWSRAESGTYILVSDPIHPMQNVINFTGRIENGRLTMAAMGSHFGTFTRGHSAGAATPQPRTVGAAPQGSSAPALSEADRDAAMRRGEAEQRAAAGSGPPYGAAPGNADSSRVISQAERDCHATGGGYLLETGECHAVPARITRPVWTHRPTANDFLQYYPPDALQSGQEAAVRLDCIVGSSGELACTMIAVDPTEPYGHGFGEASLRLARLFRMAPALADGTPTAGRIYTLNLRWRTSERAAAPGRRMTREEVRAHERTISDGATCEAQQGVWNAFERRCYLPNRN
ncbi:MAG: energy transducer TonB [Phycisphaerales bacterium]|nr:energy transducer TonB [Hyphomonadaceae bacterium]